MRTAKRCAEAMVEAMVARIVVQRRLALAIQIASAIGVLLTIGCAIGASATLHDDLEVVSIILALTILRSLAHLWASRSLREPDLEPRQLAIAVYFLAVTGQGFAVATIALWLLPMLLAWPLAVALLLARRQARWLVIADPPLPAFVICAKPSPSSPSSLGKR